MQSLFGLGLSIVRKPLLYPAGSLVKGQDWQRAHAAKRAVDKIKSYLRISTPGGRVVVVVVPVVVGRVGGYVAPGGGSDITVFHK